MLEQRAEALAKLQSLALTDELTGLANRRAWELGLSREVARAAREGGHLCVAVLDFDHFKAFNDERGHQAGDDLLEQTARAWQRMIRATDLLSRYGGEEFALAFPAWPVDIALTVIERLRDVVPEGQTCSAGPGGLGRRGDPRRSRRPRRRRPVRGQAPGARPDGAGGLGSG